MLLKIECLLAGYGQNQVLHGIDLEVEKGQLVAIIGGNGAGKSTLLNCISGLVKWHGSISFNGAPLSPKSHRVVKAGIFQVPEGRRVFAGLTVEENLLAGAYTCRGAQVHALLDQQYDLFPVLKQRRLQDAGTLSGGEQQMLVICRALMGKPRLLLLDEPSLGLAPKMVEQVFRTIQEIRDQGVTILLVEQNAKKALGISDYAYVIENGKIALSGPGKEILRNPQVEEAYLGAKRT